MNELQKFLQSIQEKMAKLQEERDYFVGEVARMDTQIKVWEEMLAMAPTATDSGATVPFAETGGALLPPPIVTQATAAPSSSFVPFVPFVLVVKKNPTERCKNFSMWIVSLLQRRGELSLDEICTMAKLDPMLEIKGRKDNDIEIRNMIFSRLSRAIAQGLIDRHPLPRKNPRYFIPSK